VENLGLILKLDVNIHLGVLDLGENLVERVEFVGLHRLLKVGLSL
jgi:hypothetical protein